MPHEVGTAREILTPMRTAALNPANDLCNKQALLGEHRISRLGSLRNISGDATSGGNCGRIRVFPEQV
jgi:hypothetical protein